TPVAGRVQSGAMHDRPLLLRRIDPSRNMARFSALSLEPSLFGGVALVRRWGRIGTRGHQALELRRDLDAGRAALLRRVRAKRRRGYRPVGEMDCSLPS